MGSRALRAVGIILALTISGCAAMNKQMASWEGRSVSDLIATWGPPTSTYSDGSGGTVVAWVYGHGSYSPAVSYTTGNARAYRNGKDVEMEGGAMTVYYPAVASTWTSYRVFWADSSGTIYRWAWKGLE
jgi:hypothetical protein